MEGPPSPSFASFRSSLPKALPKLSLVTQYDANELDSPQVVQKESSKAEEPPTWTRNMVEWVDGKHGFFLRAPGPPQSTKLEPEGFKLPERERTRLEKMLQEFERNKYWSVFDSVFGILLLCSSLIVGLQAAFPAYGLLWDVLDKLFVLVFMIELVGRFWWAGPTWRLLLKDPWIHFDIIVIASLSLSIAEELIIGSICADGDCETILMITRLFRLVRVAKMLRLIRSFKSLGMLVEGIFDALRMLIWTFIISGMVLWVCAILMLRMLSWASTVASQKLEDYTDEKVKEGIELELASWPNIGASMWNLMQMMTWDQWADRVRIFMFDLGGPEGFAATFFVFMFLAICACGLLNLVLAVMCHEAFDMNRRRRATTGGERLLKQRRSLVRLQKILSSWGERPILQKAQYMTPAEFWTTLSDPQVARCIKALDLGTKELLDLVHTFEIDGEFEINALTEAIAVQILTAYYNNISTAFIDPHNNTGNQVVNPVDMIFYSNALSNVESDIKYVQVDATMAAACMHDVVADLEERVVSTHALYQANPDGTNQDTSLMNSQVTTKDSSLHATVARASGVYFKRCLDEAQVSMLELRINGGMDAVFGSVIALNSLFITWQAQEGDKYEDKDSTVRMLLFVADQIFTVVFLLEFVLRLMLAAQLNPLILEKHAEGMQRLKASLILGLFPRWPYGGCRSIVAVLPSYLRVASNVIDAVAVCVSVVDSWFFVWMQRAGLLENLDRRIVNLLKLMRFLRAAKMFRIFKLFPRLQVILHALVNTYTQWCAALLLQTTAIYGFAVFINSWLGPSSTEEGTKANYYFGTFWSCLMTCWQLSTLDDWGVIMNEASRINPYMIPLIMLFMFVVGIGVLNLVVGFMAESAVDILVFQQQMTGELQLIEFLRALHGLQDVLKNRMGMNTITLSLISACMVTEFDEKRVLAAGVDDPFMGELLYKSFQAAKAAGLRPSLAEQIFRSLDYDKVNEIGVDMFCQGCVELSDDISNVNLFSTGRLFCHMWELQRQVSMRVRQCHVAISQMFCMIHSGANWSHFDQNHIRNLELYANGRSLKHLDEVAERAVEDFVKSGGDGDQILGQALDEHGFKGLTLSVGAGTISWASRGEIIRGHGVDFKRDVKIGDIIVAREQVARSTNAEADDDDYTVKVAEFCGENNGMVHCFVVQKVLDRTSLKVVNNSSQFLPCGKGFTYFLVRQPQDDLNSDLEVEQAAKLPIHSLSVSEMTPRSQQKMFSWEADGYKQKQNQMAALKHENLMLRAEVDTLISELSDVRDIMLKRRVFAGITKIRANKVASKRSSLVRGEANHVHGPVASLVNEREESGLQLPAIPPPAEIPMPTAPSGPPPLVLEEATEVLEHADASGNYESEEIPLSASRDAHAMPKGPGAALLARIRTNSIMQDR